MTSISDLCEVCHDLGAKRMHNWVSVSTHKQAKKGGHVPFTYCTQLVSCSIHLYASQVLVTETGKPIKRFRSVASAGLPLSHANITFTGEAAAGKIFFHNNFLVVQDESNSHVNPARKAWQEVYQFLFQFANPEEPQIIFSMLDGLGAVSQAALQLGFFDVIAFEKDEATWTAAGKVVANEIEKLKKKEQNLMKKMQTELKGQEIAEQVQEGSKKYEELEKDEVKSIRSFHSA